MNRLFTIILVAAAVTVVGCKEKKQTDDIIAPREEVQQPQGPIRMQNYDDSREVTWLGKQYTVAIKREADDSLRMVKDETGQKFVDNRITLRIIRADGSVFFQRVLTKAAFDAYLDGKYRQEGILEGVVFDQVNGNQLSFAGSVSLPQTDEYIPLVMTVDNFGNVSMRRDTELDTRGDDTNGGPDDDEDGV